MPACGVRPEAMAERHRQRQGDQADGDAGDQVVQKFVQAVIAQAEDGLRQPALVREDVSSMERQLSQVQR